MKGKKILVTAVIALMLLSIPTVLAGPIEEERDPGHSPGYWKHQLKVYFNDRGHAQESWSDMLDYEIFIQDEYPQDPEFTLAGAFEIFTDPSMNKMWLTIANYFNDAAGLAPYVDMD